LALAVQGNVKCFVLRPPRERPNAWLSRPLLRPRRAECARTIVESSNKCSKSGSPPKASTTRSTRLVAPTIVALKDRVPVAEAFEQVAPRSPSLRKPKHGIEESIVFGGLSRVALLPGQMGTDLFPLLIREFVSRIGSLLHELSAAARPNDFLGVPVDECQHNLVLLKAERIDFCCMTAQGLDGNPVYLLDEFLCYRFKLFQDGTGFTELCAGR
jgi:hypothetical protein